MNQFNLKSHERNDMPSYYSLNCSHAVTNAHLHFNERDQCAHLNMKIELEKFKLADIASYYLVASNKK